MDVTGNIVELLENGGGVNVDCTDVIGYEKDETMDVILSIVVEI